jgi:hypothetical protein
MDNHVSEGREILELKNLKKGIHSVTVSCKTGSCSEGYELTSSCDVCGDLNGDVDGKVNIIDIFIIARAYGSLSVDDPETPVVETRKWDARADLDFNGVINIRDLFKVARVFGGTCPVSGEV